LIRLVNTRAQIYDAFQNREILSVPPALKPPADTMENTGSEVQETLKGGIDYSMKKTVLESQEWQEIMEREKEIGPEALLEEILEQRTWTNSEILWTIRRMIFYYALHDKVLQRAPVERIFENFVSMMRGFYMIFDQANPDLDDNIRSYISAKIADATWGINAGTRYYLSKISK